MITIRQVRAPASDKLVRDRARILPYYEHLFALDPVQPLLVERALCAPLVEWLAAREIEVGYDYAYGLLTVRQECYLAIAFANPDHAFEFKMRWIGAQL